MIIEKNLMFKWFSHCKSLWSLMKINTVSVFSVNHLNFQKKGSIHMLPFLYYRLSESSKTVQNFFKTLIISIYLWPHRDSNPDRWYRKPQFYPLNYGANAGAKVINFILYDRVNVFYDLNLGWKNRNLKFPAYRQAGTGPMLAQK